jgi:branched-chain amino acid transport system permease protein
VLAYLPEAMRGFGQYRLAVYCIILMGIALFAPQGLVAPLWRRLTERAR